LEKPRNIASTCTFWLERAELGGREGSREDLTRSRKRTPTDAGEVLA
jgi:hypothetical protein